MITQTAEELAQFLKIKIHPLPGPLKDLISSQRNKELENLQWEKYKVRISWFNYYTTTNFDIHVVWWCPHDVATILIGIQWDEITSAGKFELPSPKQLLKVSSDSLFNIRTRSWSIQPAKLPIWSKATSLALNKWYQTADLNSTYGNFNYPTIEDYFKTIWEWDRRINS